MLTPKKNTNGYVVNPKQKVLVNMHSEATMSIVFDELTFRYLISVIEDKVLTPESQRGKSQYINHPIGRCLLLVDWFTKVLVSISFDCNC